MKIKPAEVWTLKYWLHLGIIAVIVLAILQLFTGGDMLNLKNILWSIPILAIGDVVAHSILNLE